MEFLTNDKFTIVGAAGMIGSNAISALPFRRSSRVMPALRAAPPDDTIYLAPVRASLMSEV